LAERGQAFRYDGALTTGSTWSGAVTGAVDFNYDTALRLAGIKVNGTTRTQVSYDRDGLPTTIGGLSLFYRGDNGLLERMAGAGSESRWVYDSLGQVATYAVVSSSNPADTVFRAGYTYDRLGRVIGLAESVQVDTATYAFGYDASGRLATVQKSGATIAGYNYDPNGNRTQTVSPSQSISAAYDAQDRLLSYGANTYAYTGNGELRLRVVGTDSTKYRYDAVGNLRDVNLPNGDHIEYVIDAQQRRIGRKLNGALLKGWLYQSQLAIAAEVDGAGQVTKTFEYATHGNVPDRMQANGSVYRIITDHLGSVRLVVEVSGVVAQRIDYDAYGRVLTNTNPGFQPFGYAGGLLDDATGLTRFGARDYDAEIGRWTAKDPLMFGAGEANVYSYASDTPTTVTDQAGLWPTGRHNQLVGLALKGIATNPQIEAIRKAGYAFDRTSSTPFGNTQTPANSYMHSMRGPGESPILATRERDQFIRRMLMQARASFLANDEPSALRCLAYAIHPYMDMTSPAHTGENGPRLWLGVGQAPVGAGLHVMQDYTSRLTPEVRRTNDILIRGAFLYVFRK
jgi:RHS repeat-associated protein